MELDKKEIDKAFEESENQQEVFVKLYNMVYGDVSKIKQMYNHPRVSKDVNTYLFDKFIEFDSKHHPDVMPGGLWMDCGFSGREEVKGWKVIPGEVELEEN